MKQTHDVRAERLLCKLLAVINAEYSKFSPRWSKAWKLYYAVLAKQLEMQQQVIASGEWMRTN